MLSGDKGAGSAVFKQTQITSKAGWCPYVKLYIRARSTHSKLKEADLQMECQLNGGNLRYTGLSSEAKPTAVMAELLSVGCSR